MDYILAYSKWLFRKSEKDLINFILCLLFFPILLIIQLRLIENRLFLTIIMLIIFSNLFRIVEDYFKKRFKKYNKELPQSYFFILAILTVVTVYVSYFLWTA